MKVDYIRDGLIEESHNIDFVLLSDKPKVNGNIYYFRSCAKPLQASLIIDYGVDVEYDFSDEELAICCASHAGEDIHISLVSSILDKIGLDESYLKCGIHSPLSETKRKQMLLKGEAARAIHNNCSGKHAGFLAICKKNNYDLLSYDNPEHKLQKEIKAKITELCEIKEKTPITTDGCGVPIMSAALYNLTFGYRNLFSDNKYSKIKHAFLKNPYVIGGENRLDTEIMQNSKLIAKVGAGGLCVVYNPEKDDCFALKVEDSSMDARRIAVLEMINRLKWANIEYDNTIKTISGKIVGEIILK